MSRVGKKPIEIPDQVEVEIKKNKVKIKGPKGTLDFKVRPEIKVEKKENQIVVSIKKETKKSPALWGTTRSVLANMVEGVRKGFQKKLEIQGIGYKARLEGDKLVLEVGFSHPIEIKKPSDIDLKVEKNKIIVSGIDKSRVGEVAAKIRAIKPPEPYKGKGIRYEGEEVRRKEGKKAAGTLEEGA